MSSVAGEISSIRDILNCLYDRRLSSEKTDYEIFSIVVEISSNEIILRRVGDILKESLMIEQEKKIVNCQSLVQTTINIDET